MRYKLTLVAKSVGMQKLNLKINNLNISFETRKTIKYSKNFLYFKFFKKNIQKSQNVKKKKKKFKKT